MIEVRQTDEFARWLAGLRDAQAKARIARRLARLARGNVGDAKPVGGGVSELRFHFGPGYRVYFVRHGDRVILLLAGGIKSTQDRDIRTARRLAKAFEDQ